MKARKGVLLVGVAATFVTGCSYRTLRDLQEDGGDAAQVPVDVRDGASPDDSVDQAAEPVARPDVAVEVAGDAGPSPNGSLCSQNVQCLSGHCVDGVCCDGACGGQCESCAEPGSLGTCLIVSGSPRG